MENKTSLSFDERTEVIHQLIKMPTAKALQILFEWHGSRHLIDKEFRDYAVMKGYINIK